MHELASFYGVTSQSFGEDPYRHISFYKDDKAAVPRVTLSKVVANLIKARAKPTTSRLSFLPLRAGAGNTSAVAPNSENAAPRPPAAPIQRGWEKLEKKPARVIADAWSDNEDDNHERNDDGDTSK
jgi:hypothetical protein